MDLVQRLRDIDTYGISATSEAANEIERLQGEARLANDNADAWAARYHALHVDYLAVYRKSEQLEKDLATAQKAVIEYEELANDTDDELDALYEELEETDDLLEKLGEENAQLRHDAKVQQYTMEQVNGLNQLITQQRADIARLNNELKIARAQAESHDRWQERENLKKEVEQLQVKIALLQDSNFKLSSLAGQYELQLQKVREAVR